MYPSLSIVSRFIYFLHITSIISLTLEFMLLERVQCFGNVRAGLAGVSGEVNVYGLDVRDDRYPLPGVVAAAGTLVGVRSPRTPHHSADHRAYHSIVI